jgi:hypothetical protein
MFCQVPKNFFNTADQNNNLVQLIKTVHIRGQGWNTHCSRRDKDSDLVKIKSVNLSYN